MMCVGWLGYIYVVDVFIKCICFVVFGVVFVGVLVGLQKDMIDYVVYVVDRDGFDKCFFMGVV